MLPKVSIIIPCFNSSRFVEKTIYSALLQEYENFEVIAIDNESTDNTYEIIKKIKKEFSNLIIGTAPNIYKNSSKEPVEEAYRLLTGDFFTILDSDDYIKNDYLKNNINYLYSTNEKKSVWQSQILGVNKDGGILSLQNHEYNSLENLKEKMLKYCAVNSPTVFYDSNLISTGLLTERPDLYSGFCDYDKFCRLIDAGHFIHSSNKWFGHFYRWHDNQDTWSVLKNKNNYNLLIQDYWKQKWNK